MKKSKLLDILYAGTLAYDKALSLQYELVEKRKEGLISDTLILLEHPPVITRGKSASAEEILAPLDTLADEKIEIIDVDRGGKSTYHGPGQIIGYIISDLNESHRGNVADFVSKLETLFISLLKHEFNIEATRDCANRGVWIGNNKITAIGIRIKRGITLHGFAFNVNTKLEHFSYILPCGIEGKGVCRLADLVQEKVETKNLLPLIARYFAETFGYSYTS